METIVVRKKSHTLGTVVQGQQKQYTESYKNSLKNYSVINLMFIQSSLLGSVSLKKLSIKLLLLIKRSYNVWLFGSFKSL
jgi:hypothetical protein